MSEKKKLFCFGYGYSCDYLGHDLLEEGDGWTIAGTTRSQEKKDILTKRGIKAHIFEHEHPLPDPELILKGTTHLLISTPPDDEGDPAFIAHAADIMKINTLEWVGYLSTTGVYGDRAGHWVDEKSEVRPSTIRGSRRARAEEQWLSLLSKKFPLHIFRLAGIYGPGRSALDSVRVGTARRINKQGHIFSRIHVEDVAHVLRTSIANPNPGAVYNLCDDDPAPSHEIISYACELLKRPQPPLIPFEEADMTPMARSFYSDNKRVNNNRIKDELGVRLKYPTYKEGLKACFDAEQHAIKLFKTTPF